MSSEVSTEKDIERIFEGFAIEAQKQIPQNWHKQKKRVIIISGPTCCGKSAFSLELAESIGGEIISADSMQVYRGMDIGTAKVTNEEQARVPHHLIDIRDVNEPFNVVDFYYEARQCCQTILARDNVPIVVGGAGFYIHSFLYGPPNGPPSVPEVRKALEEEIEKLGSDALYERLRQLDLQYANTITKHDKQKIVRALEIIKLTGKMVSKLAWKGRRKPLNYDFRCWFLHRPRENLYKLIDRRCDKMVEEGLLEEVQRLEKNGIRTNTSASQAIGYRQFLDYLQTNQSPEDYQKCIKSFKQASRNFAKRQCTWFNNEPLFNWVDMDLHDPEVVLDLISQDYQSR